MSISSSIFTEYFLTDFSVYKQCEECRININVSTVSVEVIHVGPSLFDPRALVRPICTFGDNFCTFGDNFLAPCNYSYVPLPPPFPPTIIVFHSSQKPSAKLQVFKLMIQNSEVRTHPLNFIKH